MPSSTALRTLDRTGCLAKLAWRTEAEPCKSPYTPPTNLSKLIEAALKGEEVVIARGDKPVVKLVAIGKQPFRYGILADVLKGPIPDFEPMSGDELDELDREKEERLARGAP